MTPREVLHVAHRAANDLDLLRAAADARVDLVEADVKLRRGRLEVRHAKTLGPVPWHWEPWYLVRPSGLVLSQVAAVLPDTPPVMLDLKGWQPWLGERVRDAMASEAPGVPYAVCSRHWRLLDAFAGVEGVRLVHSARTAGELRRLPARLVQVPTWGVSVHRSLLTPERVARLHEQAEVVMTWPVDDAAGYREVVGLGVTGVIADDLAALPPR